MPDFFANPLGFLGLLAVPAILIIHLLREKSRRIRVSTLFLLERLPPRTPRGRTIHFLQNSRALWLQLLIALLCTWLLVQPHWLRRDSTQRVTVILDNSASMSAFRTRILDELPRILGVAARAAARTDWVVLTSDQPETPLFHGTDLRGLLGSLDAWQPFLPSHDPSPAFSLALLDSRGGGTILFVTDHAMPSVPPGITAVAFGQPIENCGFAGVKTWQDREGAHWEALIRNAGTTPQVRDWWMEAEEAKGTPQKAVLSPGQIATVTGLFPPGQKHLRLRLTPDQFALDDVFPLVPPSPKPLSIFVHASPVTSRFCERVVATIPGAKRVSDPAIADVAIGLTSELAGVPPDRAAVLLAPAGPSSARTVLGALTAERHPYTEGLVWDGLLSTGPAALERKPVDLPLLWQADQPLIFLQNHGGTPRLALNFDFEASNADRLPAFVLLLSRYLRHVQEEKTEHFAENFETNQTLPPLPPHGELTEDSGPVRQQKGTEIKAPLRPGFFEVRAGGVEILEGSAHFGDPREADFREAASTPFELARSSLIKMQNSDGDSFAALWLGVIGVALAASWTGQAK